MGPPVAVGISASVTRFDGGQGVFGGDRAIKYGGFSRHSGLDPESRVFIGPARNRQKTLDSGCCRSSNVGAVVTVGAAKMLGAVIPAIC